MFCLLASIALRVVRLFGVFAVLLLVVIVAGCGGRDGTRGPTTQKTTSLKAFVFYDVQPRGGGHALWGKKNGEVFVQVVTPKGAAHFDQLMEKRYHLKSRPGIFSEVELIVGNRKLMSVHLKKGAGDNRTTIVLVPTTGPTVKLTQQGNISDPGFDQLSSYLRGRCDEIGSTEKPVYEGQYDKDWRPEGFQRPW